MIVSYQSRDITESSVCDVDPRGDTAAMAVDDDPRLFYYNLDCHVRELPYSALTRIGQRLIASLPGRDWRAIGDQLGYTMAQMENFEHQRIPGYELLRDWSMRTGTTIRVLQSRLRSIGRDDIVLELDDIRQSTTISTNKNRYINVQCVSSGMQRFPFLEKISFCKRISVSISFILQKILMTF